MRKKKSNYYQCEGPCKRVYFSRCHWRRYCRACVVVVQRRHKRDYARRQRAKRVDSHQRVA